MWPTKGDGPEQEVEFCPPNIPREVYKLVCALQRLGSESLDLNDIVDNSTFIRVRNALENDFPKDLTQLRVSALALYSALLRLFETLKDPLIPFSVQRELRVACSDPTALWKIISTLPPVNAATIEFLTDYLRELISQVPEAIDQLIPWADVLFRGGALLTTVPHLEPRVVALRSLCAYKRDVVLFSG
ncbi:RhoGAP domain protein [Oesophagostomum dentatum]|uniref:RhoGAP domain protein n=1 Tax=Oesophagostomum dentatum TaxID=61180 RepID=A0A0B1SPD9_OESDE|nr:RhoGAP domain protein [Oesophagostomum dentatum]